MPAHVYGRLALLGEGTITHVLSGYAVPLPALSGEPPEPDPLAARRDLVERLADLDWDWPAPDPDSMRYLRTVEQATKIISAWLAERPQAAGARAAAQRPRLRQTSNRGGTADEHDTGGGHTVTPPTTAAACRTVPDPADRGQP